MTWDNAVYISPGTAAKHNLTKTNFPWTGGEHGRAEVGVVELKFHDRKVRAPVWVLPGHPDNSVTIHLGFGRERAGRVAHTPNEPNAAGEPYRGFNAYELRTSDALWFAGGLTLAKTDKSYFLACIQGHFKTAQRDPISGLEMDRKPVRYGTLDRLQEGSRVREGSTRRRQRDAPDQRECARAETETRRQSRRTKSKPSTTATTNTRDTTPR